MIDPGFNSVLALALEQAINTALKLDPGTRARLRKLGKSLFHFSCSAPETNFYFEIHAFDPPDRATHVSVASYSEKTVTTKISASLLDTLLFLATGKLEGSTNLVGSGISILGDSAKLMELQGILQDLDIDWEQALQEVSTPGGEIAGVLSHQAVNAIKMFLAWFNKSRTKFHDNLATYLQEELRLLPTQMEFNNFYENLAELRSDVERADARLSALLQKLKAH